MRASDKAYMLIIKKLLHGEFEPGDPIEEKKMMEILDVGKTPLREALTMLTCDGFVTNYAHRGMSFALLTVADMQSLFNLRIQLMPYLASKLINNATDEQIKEIEDHLDIVPEDFIVHEFKFHSLLNSYSKDKYLIKIIGNLEKLSFIALRAYVGEDSKPFTRDSFKELNKEIVLDLKSRDADKLTQTLIKHIPQYALVYSDKSGLRTF